MHIAYLESKISVYLAYKAQITLLLTKEISILKKYTDFLDIFSKKSAAMFLN